MGVNAFLCWEVFVHSVMGKCSFHRHNHAFIEEKNEGGREREGRTRTNNSRNERGQKRKTRQKETKREGE